MHPDIDADWDDEPPTRPQPLSEQAEQYFAHERVTLPYLPIDTIAAEAEDEAP